MRFLSRSLALVPLLLLALAATARAQPPQPAGGTFVAAPTGAAYNCSVATIRCVPSEYATITAAWNAASAGDIIKVAAGTYVATPSSTHNGTAGGPITIVADGAVTVCGMSFSNNSYIRVVGVTFSPTASTCGGTSSATIGYSGTNTGLEFWNLDVTNLETGSSPKGLANIGASDFCNSCIVLGGNYHDMTDNNAGGMTAISLNGDNNFIGYMEIQNICYVAIGPAGLRGRIVGVYVHDLIQCSTYHPDFFYIDGYGGTKGFVNYLIEGTFGIGTPTANNNKFHHQENGNNGASNVTWNDNVYRLNVGYNIGSAAHSIYITTGGGDNLRTRWYNNTWVSLQRANPASTAAGSGSAQVAGKTTTADFRNSVYYETWGAALTTNISGIWEAAGGAGTTTITDDYNLAFDPDGSVTMNTDWTGQAHKLTNTDPVFTNYSTKDFTLQSSSTARGFGSSLTTAVGSGSGSTSLTVAANTATYFFADNSANLPAYGGKLVPGDFITVGSCTAQVSSISGDVITLASACTWSNGAQVYFGKSSTIDLGAYPYNANGYAISGTFHQAGPTVTVTPGDPGNVRFAVVYENTVPTCIADASNSWACATGAGAITVLLYPRYPSMTTSTAAMRK